MARLPIPGSDDGTWGALLNDYLSQVHNPDGSLRANVIGNAQISDGVISELKLDNALRTKVNIVAGTPLLSGDLSGATDNAVINAGAVTTAKLANDAVTAIKIQDNVISEQKLDSAARTKLNATPPVSSVAGKTGVVTLAKGDVGLSNVDNTSDAQKPVSTAVSLALQGKADSTHAHAISDVTGLSAALTAKADDSQMVHVSGNEVLNGVKTFTNSPVVPDPTNDDQAASKAYVDAVASAGGTSDPTVGGDLSGTASNAQIVAGAVGTNELGSKVVTSAKNSRPYHN